MPGYDEFRSHYANRHDDELIDIARKSELLPEAHQALLDELKERGITDVEMRVAALEADLASSETQRQHNIAEKTSRVRRFGRYVNLLCFGMIVFGLGESYWKDDLVGYGGALVALLVIVLQWLWHAVYLFVHNKILMHK